MIVKFVNVGRMKKNWQAETEKLSFGWLYQQVRRNGQLISREIDIEVDEDGKGIIYAGMRSVGQIEVTA